MIRMSCNNKVRSPTVHSWCLDWQPRTMVARKMSVSMHTERMRECRITHVRSSCPGRTSAKGPLSFIYCFHSSFTIHQSGWCYKILGKKSFFIKALKQEWSTELKISFQGEDFKIKKKKRFYYLRYKRPKLRMLLFDRSKLTGIHYSSDMAAS